MSSIQPVPNQSMLDVILQSCGTLEAAMQFCQDNGLSISDYPTIGSSYAVSSDALADGDPSVTQYLSQNGWVIGTLGAVPTLSFTIVLNPVLKVQPATADPPSVTGSYLYNLAADPGFINIYPLASGAYPSPDNPVSYETEERYIDHFIPDTTNADSSSLPMASCFVQYKIPWVAFRGFMMIWSDLSAANKTLTFVDTHGNQAYFDPLVVLDNATQTVEEYLFPGLQVDLVSAGHSSVTLRLTRSHQSIAYADFDVQVLSWLDDALGGTPDPLDPTNANKTIITLSAGIYTLGTATVYWNGATQYPGSARTMVVEVS